jgi:hypothetical protein
MYDGVHAAQRMTERERIGKVAQRDLDADAVGFEPAWIAHQAPNGNADRGQAPQERQPDRPGGAGQEEHVTAGRGAGGGTEREAIDGDRP